MGGILLPGSLHGRVSQVRLLSTIERIPKVSGEGLYALSTMTG